MIKTINILALYKREQEWQAFIEEGKAETARYEYEEMCEREAEKEEKEEE